LSSIQTKNGDPQAAVSTASKILAIKPADAV
jgi:hypothetical protein